MFEVNLAAAATVIIAMAVAAFRGRATRRAYLGAAVIAFLFSLPLSGVHGATKGIEAILSALFAMAVAVVIGGIAGALCYRRPGG